MRLKSVGPIAIAAVLVCCDPSAATDQTCYHPPCPLPTAVTIHLTAAGTGNPVPGAVIFSTGPVEGVRPCNPFDCTVLGGPGTYTVTVSAPGFQSAERTVTVRGAIPPCGCYWTETVRLDIALVPAA